MSLTDILGGVNYGLAFFFGVALSVSIAGDCKDRREWTLLFLLCPVFLALQAVSWLVLGLEATKRLYPLLIHLPLLAVLVFGLKRPVGISLVSICAAYLCCQLPRCVDIAVAAATGSELAGEIVYTVIIAPIFFFLQRYFVSSARSAMVGSRRSLFLLGGLPVIFWGTAHLGYGAVRPALQRPGERPQRRPGPGGGQPVGGVLLRRPAGQAPH